MLTSFLLPKAKGILLALMLSAFAMSLSAQETRGKIEGSVLDSSSAAVVGAKVSITNTETNVTVTLVANSTGYYVGSLLIPGKYRVTVEAQGFKTFIRDGVILSAGATLPVDVTLEAGNVNEQITVTAAPPLLETSAVSSGRVLERRDIEDLPISGSNVTQLAKIAPGVQSPQGQNQFGGASFQAVGATSTYTTGGSVGGNEWSFDGTPNASNNRQLAYIPSSDVVAELRIDTSNFDASVGHNTGIVVAATSKSGANQFHGSARLTHWQQRWQALTYFQADAYHKQIAAAEIAGNTALAQKLRETSPVTGTHENNYGFTFSGPVVLPKIFNGRNKLFFFFAFNGNRTTTLSFLQATVPTLAERQGDFSALLGLGSRYQLYDPLTTRPDPARPGHYIRDPFVGNIIPKNRQVNPLLAFYAKLFPEPTVTIPANQEPINNYQYFQVSPQDYKSYLNRVDYTLSDRHRFFGRWSQSRWFPDQPDFTVGAVGRTQDIRTNIGGTLDWVYTINPKMVLDVSLAVNKFYYRFPRPNALLYKPSDVGLPAYLDARAGDRHLLSPVAFSGSAGLSDIGGTADLPRSYYTRTGKADLSWVQGQHSLHIGSEVRGMEFTGGTPGNTSGAFGFDNLYTRKNEDTFTPAADLGHAWAAFLLGFPTSATLDTNADRAYGAPYYAFYVQDSWRLTRKLNLNIGGRFEAELGAQERYNRMITNFDPTAKLPITDLAQAAYARNPIAERAASSFTVLGGATYAGVNGRGRRLWNNGYSFMPRVSAAYQINPNTVLRGGYGIYYDTLNVFNFENPGTLDQTGFSRTTSTIFTNDFGVNWLVGDPRNGVSALTNPFPVRADNTRFDEPIAAGLGLMAKAGTGWAYTNQDLPRARQQRWRFGVQRQFGQRTVLDVSYVGTYSDHQGVTKNLNALPEQYWATGQVRNNAIPSNLNAQVTNPFNVTNFASLQTSDPTTYSYLRNTGFFTNATIARNQLLRPFPQMTGLAVSVPEGISKFHALEVTLNRRFDKGLIYTLSYQRSYQKDKDVYLNEFDPEPSWRISDRARPHRFTATGIYELPFGKGRHFLNEGVLGKVVGGFQIGLIYEWQPGSLLGFGNLFFFDDPAKIKKDKKDRTLDEWFNWQLFPGATRDYAASNRAAYEARIRQIVPASALAQMGSICGSGNNVACTYENVVPTNFQPAAFHARVFPTRINGLRAGSLNLLHANIARDVRIMEKVSLQLRFEVLDVFNRSTFSGPNTDPNSTNFGRVTGTVGTNRWVQLQARLTF